MEGLTSSSFARFELLISLPAQGEVLEVPSPANCEFPARGWGVGSALCWGHSSVPEPRGFKGCRTTYPYYFLYIYQTNLSFSGPRGAPDPSGPSPQLSTEHRAAPALIRSRRVPGRANWERGTGSPCGKERGRTSTRSHVTKPHSSALALIAGFAHSLLIAGRVTAHLDGLRIKDLPREAMLSSVSLQPAWLQHFSRQSPDSGFSQRIKIMPQTLSLQLLLPPVYHFSFPIKSIYLLGNTQRQQPRPCKAQLLQRG